MAIETIRRCAICKRSGCSGREYVVDYAYDYYTRNFGQKTVCESQLYCVDPPIYRLEYGGMPTLEDDYEAVPIEQYTGRISPHDSSERLSPVAKRIKG